MKKRLDALLAFINEPLATTDKKKPVSWTQRLQTSLRLVFLLAHEFYEGRLTLWATSLAYITLLSFVPMLAVSFAMLKSFGVHNMMAPLLLELLSPLGPQSIDIVTQVVGFVENTQVTLLGTIGLTFLIYAILELMQKTEEALNEIWRIKKSRPLAKRISSYLSILLVGPVLLFAAIGVLSSLIGNDVIRAAFQIAPLDTAFYLLRLLLPYMLIFGAFTVFYAFSPNTTVNFGAALLGGVVATLLWQATGWLFAKFVAGSIRYTAVYSAFATLIVFIIWLYLSWLILLIGASVAFYYQHPMLVSLKGVSLQASERMRERLALQILLLIGQRFYQQTARYSALELAEQLAVPLVLVNTIVVQLCRAGFLNEDADLSVYSPARSLETMPLFAVFEALHCMGDDKELSPAQAWVSPVIENVIMKLDQSAATVFNGLTIRTLVLEAEALKQNSDSAAQPPA